MANIGSMGTKLISAETSTVVDIDDVAPHPENVRLGDIGAISVSLGEHGQYRPIVVQTGTGRIIAGNHTWKAAKALGWETILVNYVEVDDDQAKRILLVDNRTNDLASYDDGALVSILSELIETPAGLGGTGYDPDDLDELIASLRPVQDGDERYTPKWLFEAMDVEFDIDLAAPPGGIPYIPAKRYLTKEDDSLSIDWTDLGSVWCNPPYSNATAWGLKFAQEVTEGLFLGPLSSGTTWQTALLSKARLLWFPQPGQMEFDRPVGGAEGIRWPVWLFGLGELGETAVRNLSNAEKERGVALKPARFR